MARRPRTQVVLATHSPVLAAIPGASVLELGEHGIRPTTWDELDVVTHHRTVSSCHLANLAMRLGRRLTWDPEREDFVGDAEARSLLSRPQRKGYTLAELA